MVANPRTRDIIAASPGAAAAVTTWRARGQLHLTVIAKATFAFADGAEMPRIQPQDVIRDEVHHGRSPALSVRLTSDLAPHLPRPEVVFTGHAHPPRGAPILSFPVRLAVYSGEQPVLDKTLLIEVPAGSEKLPIIYERAFGGLGSADNPLGTNQPTILSPARQDCPAGFGPIGRFWPSRKRLLGGLRRQDLDGPIAEIPDTFDWSYFQVAPLDQRIDVLRGDEWIHLEGLDPMTPQLWTRLPGARALARVHGLSAFGVEEGQLLELHADTLRIDGDQRCCTVVWRRSFPLASEAALDTVRVIAGVELPGEELSWSAGPVAARPSSSAKNAPVDTSKTLVFEDEDVLSSQDLVPVDETEMTIELAPKEASRTPLPFRAGPPAAIIASRESPWAKPPPKEEKENPHSSTIVFSPEDDDRAFTPSPLPFRSAPRLASTPIAPARVAPSPDAAPLPEPLAAAAPPPATAALPSAPLPEPRSAAQPPARSPWGADAESAPAVISRPAKPQPQPRQPRLDVQKLLYGSSK